jgi:AraC-like DNA-binding protein
MKGGGGSRASARPAPVAGLPLEIASLGPNEQRASFRVGDTWCTTRTLTLRAGVRVTITDGAFEGAFSFVAQQPAADIELVASRGTVLRAETAGGARLELGGHTLQLGRVRRPSPLRIRADEGRLACVSVSMTADRLGELLGTPALPAAFTTVADSDDPLPLVTRALTPALSRLLDELVHAEARGAPQTLWWEAKALELVALMTGEMAASAPASPDDPRLSGGEIERLERARQRLTEDLAATRSLAELARQSGLSGTRFKSGFRALFGTSAFAYLRGARMREAQRLLAGRALSVTEVALRVGYANPSKFAAAFRRELGVPPSEAARARRARGAAAGAAATPRRRG